MAINFYFQGEPFLNKQLPEMISESFEKRIYTATSTNAHFLDSNTAKRTVESGLHRLIISIDGTTQETYEQYPGCAAFGKTAYDCKTIASAEERFDELVKKVKCSNDAKEESIKTGVPVKRGRKASTKMNVKMTLKKDSKFTISMLNTYTGVNTVYIRKAVNEWLESGVITVSGVVKSESGRGKPSIEYTVA